MFAALCHNEKIYMRIDADNTVKKMVAVGIPNLKNALNNYQLMVGERDQILREIEIRLSKTRTKKIKWWTYNMSDINEESFECPYCASPNTTLVDPSGGTDQQFTVDCEVCCRPISLAITTDEDGNVQIFAERESD